jgi:hypothetical protein
VIPFSVSRFFRSQLSRLAQASLTLQRHPDIAGQSAAAKLKCEIVRHHSSQQQAPECSIELRRETTQFINSQSTFFTHSAQFSRFDEMAQFM